jgi:pyrroline-5-carboxylate reductase
LNTKKNQFCILNSLSIIRANKISILISIAKGITSKKLNRPENIFLTRRHLQAIDYLNKDGYFISSDNTEAIQNAKLIFLCVQPKQVNSLLQEIGPFLNKEQTVISVITGVTIAQMESMLPDEIPVVRAMPNTAIAVGESMTCLASNEKGKAYLNEIIPVFNALGQTLVIDEALMQAATVLGASGIAFFMRYLRAATQGGIQMGFHPEEAQKIAVQTAKGASQLIIENISHPEVEIDKVTTPRGCTIEGLNEMEHQGFSSSLIRGLMTSYYKINNITS